MKTVLHSVGPEVLSVDVYDPPGAIHSVLVLHGAGNSSKSLVAIACELLERNGIAAIAPDFSGYGNSSGVTPNSIRERVQEASTLVSAQLIKSTDFLGVFAFSMSGQVAIDLIENSPFPISCLVLFSPAVYARSCISLPFGPEFSACIRKHRSWENTDSWRILNSFQGVLVVVTPERDEVIPEQIPASIIRAARNAHRLRIYVCGATHALSAWMNENVTAATRLMSTVLRFLDECSADAAGSQPRRCEAIQFST